VLCYASYCCIVEDEKWSLGLQDRKSGVVQTGAKEANIGGPF